MEVSVFKHLKSPEVWFNRHILACLEAISVGRFMELTNEVRNAKTKEEKTAAKAKLPAFTPSGVFSKRRADNLIKHSGFICIDIDNVHDMTETRKIIDSDPYTFASFESASGKGLAFLVKIDPEKHLESFLAIEKYYQSKKIVIEADQSCKDVSRLRFFSTDFDLYLFEQSFVWDLFPKPKPKAPPNRTKYAPSAPKIYPPTDTTEQVEKLVRRIEEVGIDITSDYADWTKIAFALQAEFGEGGREFFHRISALYSDYDSDKADKKYDECRKVNKTTIASLFFIAKHYGITLYPIRQQ
jgi:hypothetical protein